MATENTPNASSTVIRNDMFGRLDIYASFDDINEDNLIAELNEALVYHVNNMLQEEFLYWYTRGVQPILNRRKEVREDILNIVQVNTAAEIVDFKNGYFLTQPCSYVSRRKGAQSKVKKLNEYLYRSGKLEADNSFEHNYKEASDAGVMCGAYVFSQAANARDGKKEARYAVSRLKELGIEPEDLMLPVYMDYEFLNKSGSRLRNLTQKDAIAAAQAFCETVQSYGYDAGIYANSSFFSEYLNQGRDFDDDIDLWIAQYSSAIGSDCQYTKWQYSSSASIADINSDFRFSAGKVDINYWYIDKEPGESTVNISGSTNAEYTGKPVVPKLGIFDVNKRMKEGVDYIVGVDCDVDEVI